MGEVSSSNISLRQGCTKLYCLMERWACAYYNSCTDSYDSY